MSKNKRTAKLNSKATKAVKAVKSAKSLEAEKAETKKAKRANDLKYAPPAFKKTPSKVINLEYTGDKFTVLAVTEKCAITGIEGPRLYRLPKAGRAEKCIKAWLKTGSIEKATDAIMLADKLANRTCYPKRENGMARARYYIQWMEKTIGIKRIEARAKSVKQKKVA